jgi:regulator of protease activity HflC (stomatin/prohibitin superfamily)
MEVLFMFWALIIIVFIIWLGFYLYNTQLRKKVPVEGVYEVRPPLKIPTQLITWLAVGLLLLILLTSAIVIIPAGHVGVVFNAIVGVKQKPLYEGLNFIIPGVESVTDYNARTLNYTMSHSIGEGQKTTADDAVYAPTKEGLLVGLDVTILYRIEKEKAPELHRKLGPDYEDKIIRPETRNNIRMAVKDYGILDVYGPKREEIQNRIYTQLRKRLLPKRIICLEVLLRDVIFPEDFAKAIRDKQVAQQDAQKMDYVLEKERKEAERKVIEAGGQAKAIEIVQEALSKNPNYIQYLWATKLPQNVQTMVVPGSSNILINPQIPK